MAEDKTNTPDELLDLVDENDKVVGTVLKSEANQNPTIIHREAGVLLYDKSGRILLQKRSQLKKINPGLWTNTAAGHVASGEKPEKAAHRELQEELGFDTSFVLVDKQLVRAPNETHFAYFYLGKYKDEPIVCDSGEVSEAKLFSREEYKRLNDEENSVYINSAMRIERYWAGEFDRFK